MKNNPPASLFLLLLCVLLVPFLNTDATFDPVLTIKHLAAGVLVLAMNVALVLEVRKADIKGLSVNLHVVEILSLMVAIGLLSSFFATNTAEALYDSLRWAFILNLFWAIHLIKNLHSAWLYYLERALVVLASLLTLATFVLFFDAFQKGGYNHQVSYSIQFTFAHRNLLSQVLLLTTVSQFIGFGSFPRVWKVLCLGNVVLAVPLLVLLFVRSVWMASVVALVVVTAVALLRQWKMKKAFPKKLLLWTGAALLCFAVGAYFISGSGTQQTLSKQTHFIANQNYGSSGERLQLWKKSMDLVGQAPLLGVGGGNWKVEIPTTQLKNMRSEEGTLFFQRPHNDFVWVLSENGIVGLLVFLALFLTVFSSAFKQALQGDRGTPFIVLIGALSAYCVIAFFSFPKERLVHQLLFCLLLALLPGHKMLSKKVLQTSLLVFIPLSLLFSYTFYLRFESEKATRSALFERDNGNNPGVVQQIEKGLSYWAQLDNTGTPLKWYSGSAHYEEGNMLAALDDFRSAHKAHPNHVHVLNNLASTLVYFEETEEAKSLYSQAVQEAPKFMDPLINLTAVYFNEGQIDSAAAFLQQVDTNTLHPSYPAFEVTICENILLQEIEASKGGRRSALVGINNDPYWRRSVFRKSIAEGVSFSERLQTEVEYILTPPNNN